MKLRKTWIPGIIALVAVVGLSAPIFAPAAPLNLVVNGDFESGNTGFSTDYTYSHGDIVPEGVYDVLFDPHAAHSGAGAWYRDHTTGSGLMMAVNGAPELNRVVWEQTIAIEPQTTYGFIMWYANWSSLTTRDLSTLSVLFSGTEVMQVTIPSPAGVWAGQAINWDAGDLTSLTIQIFDLNTVRVGNDFSLDDLVLGDVTEPGHYGAPDGINPPDGSGQGGGGGTSVPDCGSTALLLSLAGLGLAARKLKSTGMGAHE